MQEKHGRASSVKETSSSSEEEDEEGALASGLLDEQFNSTLNAIKRKDPRVYDTSATFYTEDDHDDEPRKTGKDRPVYLNDYHRENLLRASSEDGTEPTTYARQQDVLKDNVVREMHEAAVQIDSDEEAGKDTTDFLVKKSGRSGADRLRNNGVKMAIADISMADQNPDEFLTRFVSSRAWIPEPTANLHPFESDDEDQERRAEELEDAYNLRFENPEAVNEKLVSHARDTATMHSVRKVSSNKRQRAREKESSAKEAAKKERSQEIARLRKLKIDEMEGKIRCIKDAAGLEHDTLSTEDWSTLLTEDWDDQRWEAEMRNRFGNRYYAEADVDKANGSPKKGRPRKPKWDHDIDIEGIVPDPASSNPPSSSVTNDPQAAEQITGFEARKEAGDGKQRRQSRKDRKLVEQLVEKRLDMDVAANDIHTKGGGHFRYRETSPQSFNLTTQDILMATDSQLNQYAGVKKLASFRDPDKKRKDKKWYSKKAKLREWRKEVFGSESVPETVRSSGFPKNEANEASSKLHVRSSDKRRKGMDKAKKRRAKG